MKAIHNKDYSVVKTFSTSPICGAFFIHLNYWFNKMLTNSIEVKY